MSEKDKDKKRRDEEGEQRPKDDPQEAWTGIFDKGQTEKDHDPGKPSHEPHRTPGTAEGGNEDSDPGKPTREPDRTPGQAEG